MIATPAKYAPVLRFRISGIIARSQVGRRLYIYWRTACYTIVRVSITKYTREHASFAFFNSEDLKQLNDLTLTDYKFRITDPREPRSCSKKNC